MKAGASDKWGHKTLERAACAAITQGQGQRMGEDVLPGARVGLKPGGSARLDCGEAGTGALDSAAGPAVWTISPCSAPATSSSSASVAASLRSVPSPWSLHMSF